MHPLQDMASSLEDWIWELLTVVRLAETLAPLNQMVNVILIDTILFAVCFYCVISMQEIKSKTLF